MAKGRTTLLTVILTLVSTNMENLMVMDSTLGIMAVFILEHFKAVLNKGKVNGRKIQNLIPTIMKESTTWT